MTKYIKILSYLLLIFFCLEATFHIIYLFTNSHYFENKYQTEINYFKNKSIKSYQENIFKFQSVS